MPVTHYVHARLGRDLCLRCFNWLNHVELYPDDCVFGDPYPRHCSCCGQMKLVVTDLKKSGRIKLGVRDVESRPAQTGAEDN